MTTATVDILFQTKPNGATDWTDLFTVRQIAPAVNGTATIDTGFQNLAAAPGKGDQYRIKANGSWSNNGPPVTGGDLPGTASLAITPVP
jgi:hypothetical protein